MGQQMYNPDADAPLFNSVPAVVVVLTVLIGAAEAVFQLGEAGMIGGPGAIGWRLAMIERFGFYVGAVQVLWERGDLFGAESARFLTYPFLHGGAADALMSAVFVLAVGKGVAERLSVVTVVAVFVVASIVTGLAAMALLGPRSLLIGAWAPICGLIGALSWALWLQGRVVGAPPVRAFALLGGLAVIQVVFWFIGGGLGPFELGFGAVTGVAVAGLLHPVPGRGPGWWVDRMRDRG